MASNRLERIGTIFSRTKGLLSSEAMKFEDKPLWYDLYAAFPPELEPRFDRPAPQYEIRKIFYEEDITRAKFHQTCKNIGIANLRDVRYKTQSQQFLEIYKKLKSEGAIDEQQIFKTAVDLLGDSLKNRNPTNEQSTKNSTRSNLLQNFTEAKTGTINIKDIL